jgi:DNA end-binding protein Ku
MNRFCSPCSTQQRDQIRTPLVSLVLIPVRLIPAVSTDEAISFRQIHEPSGTPIRQVKGIRDGDTFTEVQDEEIVKGYEYAKR